MWRRWRRRREYIAPGINLNKIANEQAMLPCTSCGFKGIRKGVCSQAGCGKLVCNSKRHHCRYYCSYQWAQTRDYRRYWRETADVKKLLFCPECYFAHHRCGTCLSDTNCCCCKNEPLAKCDWCKFPLCQECSKSGGCVCIRMIGLIKEHPIKMCTRIIEGYLG